VPRSFGKVRAGFSHKDEGVAKVEHPLLLAGLALPALARTRPHYGGTLRVEIEGDAWTQNGTQAGELGSPLARRLIFDGLTRVDADGTVSPALAVRWASENKRSPVAVLAAARRSLSR
jgi:ABC-type transport system substrate-binding protein